MNAEARSRKRLEEAGSILMVLGLVTWYAGGSSALDLLRDGWPLVRLTTGLSVVTFVGVCVGLARVDRRALGLATFMAACTALPCVTLSALLNRYADSSPGWTEAASVKALRDPTKGPRMIELQLERETGGARRVSVQASHAQGCSAGQPAQLHMRSGALGWAWIAKISCGQVRRLARAPAGSARSAW